jgi:sec-independent protein translocase protein TatC
MEKTDKALVHDQAVDSNEQPFLDHIIELRARILKSLGLLALFFIPIFFFAEEIYAFVAAPIMAYQPDGKMIATGVASPFFTPLMLSMYVALYVAMPFILHQAWAFIAPGLYLHEKKFAIPLLVSSILLFYTGSAFAYYAVFPLVFQFFAEFNVMNAVWMTDISAYLDFVIRLFFAFGIAFEVPIATLLLIWSGITTADSLADKRPYIVVGCFALGMLLTPPDVISQILLAVPMWLLFELGVWLARVTERHTNEPDPSG